MAKSKARREVETKRQREQRKLLETEADLRRREKLEEYLDDLIHNRKFSTHREIADELQITECNLSQVLREPKRFLSVEQCLRLARLVDEYPGKVLREAGRKEMADIIDGLWPRRQNFMALTAGERELVTQWRTIPSKTRHHLISLIAISAERAAARSAGPATKTRHGSPALRLKLRPVASR